MHLQGGAPPGARSEGSACAHSSLRPAQVLSQEEYAYWLQSHLEAEASVDNREELLFQSASRLETNLQLLGNQAPSACCVDQG